MSASNSNRICVVGASGSGKSSYAKRYIKDKTRVVILDPADEYSAEGAIRCTTVTQVQQIMAKSFKKFCIALVPTPGSEQTALNQLSHLCLKAQAPFKGKPRGPELVLVVDEMNLSYDVRSGEARVKAFSEIASRGRHSFISVVGISQGLAEIGVRFRRNINECVVFRQQGKNDIQAALDQTGATKAEIVGLKNLQWLRSAQGEITTGELKFKKSK